MFYQGKPVGTANLAITLLARCYKFPLMLFKNNCGFCILLLKKWFLSGIMKIKNIIKFIGGVALDVIIRGVDPQYIKEIDRKAEEIKSKTGSKFSRNDYLKSIIRTDSEIDLINYKKAEFDLAIDKLLLSQEELIANISELTKVYERVFNFLIAEAREK